MLRDCAAHPRAAAAFLKSLVPSVVLLLAGIGFGSSAIAAPPPDAVAAAKHRQQVMKQMGADLKKVHGFAEGMVSQGDAQKSAADLAMLAKQVPALFPPGTGQNDLSGISAAKPEIWDNPDDMSALEAVLARDTAALQTAVSSGDGGGTGPAFTSLAHDACGACHQSYRGKADN